MKKERMLMSALKMDVLLCITGNAKGKTICELKQVLAVSHM